MLIYDYICWFFLYSVAGWLYESILCSAIEKQWINRGFLSGPYCPIYGFGALINILVLDESKNVLVLFYLGAVTACTLEYFTSWLMEKTFNARWWDYSGHRFNLNGRISMAGAVVFGVFSVILIRIIHPEVLVVTEKLSDQEILISAWIIVGVFLLDSIVTVSQVVGFNKKLKLADIRLPVSEIKLQLSEIKSAVSKLNFNEIRILRAFPRFKSVKYNDAFQLVKEAYRNTIWRNRSKKRATK